MINTLEESLARGYHQLSTDSLRLQRAFVAVCLRRHMEDCILFMLKGDPGFLPRGRRREREWMNQEHGAFQVIRRRVSGFLAPS